MKPFHRMLTATLLAIAAATPAYAAKDVVFAVASTFTTTDPYDANDTLSQAMAKSFYEGLYGFDKDMKMVPVLAESYEASKDGLVYTVKLRKGVKFHDGTDFKADAVKVNLDRVTNPDNKLKRYGLYNDNIAKTEVVDDYTVRFTLKTAFSPFIAQLAHPSTVMISPAALKQWGNKDIAFHPVGTGPFKFVEWKATDYLKVAKFDGYWRQGYPKVDTITWKPVVDNNSRAALMQTGEAHFTFPVPYEVAEVLKAKPDLEVVAAPSIVLRYLSMNTQQKPFDNPKVRQAIAYAINKDALAKVAFSGYATPAAGVAPQGVEYAVKIGPWPYDVAKAKQLLTEAGYPSGLELTLNSPQGRYVRDKEVAEAVAGQLTKAGIKTQLKTYEFVSYLNNLVYVHKPGPVWLIGWGTPTLDAETVYGPLFRTGSNLGNYSNADFDGMVDQAQTETNEKQRLALYHRINKLWLDDMPAVPLYQQLDLYGASKRLNWKARSDELIKAYDMSIK